MRKFAEINPAPRRPCRFGWHTWVWGQDPDHDVLRRCKHCLVRRRDRDYGASKWLSDRGLPHIHGCAWDGHCRHWGAPLRISLMWGKREGKYGSLWCDLPDYMRNPFEGGRRTWSWGTVVLDLEDARTRSIRRWSFPRSYARDSIRKPSE